MRAAAESTRVEPARLLMNTKKLSFEIGGKLLINQVNLEIYEGRRTVIMGANGAGKSLLLRLLHGLLPASSGIVNWRGKPLDKAGKLEQAMVLQRPVMLRRTVAANMNFALSVRGVRGREKDLRVHHALAHAHLTDLASRPARVLSGGEQQRLALARTLVCEPAILFLDEPTASLDPASTHAIEQLVLDVNAQGTTIVMVTHDRGQARRLGQDLVFMHEGRVAETGVLPDALEHPSSEAAQAWIEGRLLFQT